MLSIFIHLTLGFAEDGDIWCCPAEESTKTVMSHVQHMAQENQG